MPGAVGPILELADVSADLNGALVSVNISNVVGSTRAAATLAVSHWPDLRFTEVMAVPAKAEQNRQFGWVELTNFDTNTIDLSGWRFAEEDSFVRAVTITNSLQLRPHESLVIAERLDERRFAEWWGARALPEDFKLHTYSGFGLEPFGGTFYLWNAAARDPRTEFVTAVSWPSSFAGISYECDFWCFDGICVSEAYRPSRPGQKGAFLSEDGLDLGSPGYTESPPLKIVAIARDPAGPVALTCRVVPGKSYQLWRATSLVSPDWFPVQTATAANNVVTFFDDGAAGASCFYRVEALP